jgi:hypothetical protein
VQLPSKSTGKRGGTVKLPNAALWIADRLSGSSR